MPVAVTDASTNVDSTDARLVAVIQISVSMAPDCHNDSAIITAIWVLPHALSQSGGPSADAEFGTSATAEPGTTSVHDPASGVGTVSKSLGQRRHLAYPGTAALAQPTFSLGHHRPPHTPMLPFRK